MRLMPLTITLAVVRTPTWTTFFALVVEDFVPMFGPIFRQMSNQKAISYPISRSSSSIRRNGRQRLFLCLEENHIHSALVFHQFQIIARDEAVALLQAEKLFRQGKVNPFIISCFVNDLNWRPGKFTIVQYGFKQ